VGRLLTFQSSLYGVHDVLFIDDVALA